MPSGVNNQVRRPSLALQIERLDDILDGLAEAIPGAVEEALRQALATTVQQAVQAALAEALKQQSQFRPAPAQPTPSRGPSLFQRLKSRLQRFRAWAWGKCQNAGEKVKTNLSSARAWVWGWLGALQARCSASWQRFKAQTALRLARLWWWTRLTLDIAWSSRRALGLGLLVGVTTGWLSFLSGPVVAASGCGLAAALITGVWLWALPVLRLLRQSTDD